MEVAVVVVMVAFVVADEVIDSAVSYLDDQVELRRMAAGRLYMKATRRGAMTKLVSFQAKTQDCVAA